MFMAILDVQVVRDPSLTKSQRELAISADAMSWIRKLLSPRWFAIP